MNISNHIKIMNIMIIINIKNIMTTMDSMNIMNTTAWMALVIDLKVPISFKKDALVDSYYVTKD